MEQFLYRIQPVRHDMLTKGSSELESRIVSEHFNYLKRLTEDGVVILAGRKQNTDYSSFGIVVLKAETIQAAREIMLNDPAVKNKVFRAELFCKGMRLSLSNSIFLVGWEVSWRRTLSVECTWRRANMLSRRHVTEPHTTSAVRPALHSSRRQRRLWPV